MKLKRGFFITFEGGDGCGKTTQSRMLVDKLKQKYDVIYAREPGATRLGEEMRRLTLVERESRSPETDLLLFETSRRHFTETLIIPNLKAGKIFVSDRYRDSTTAYQGYASGIDLDIIDYFNGFASCGINPNLTFIIDIDAKQGLEKAISQDTRDGHDNMASRALEFHEKVNQGYREIAKKNPDRCVLIPYQYGGMMSMHGRIYKITLERLSKIPE